MGSVSLSYFRRRGHLHPFLIQSEFARTFWICGLNDELHKEKGEVRLIRAYISPLGHYCFCVCLSLVSLCWHACKTKAANARAECERQTWTVFIDISGTGTATLCDRHLQNGEYSQTRRCIGKLQCVTITKREAKGHAWRVP